MTDIDPEEFLSGNGNELRTKLPGVEVTTRLADALARAEEATRM